MNNSLRTFFLLMRTLVNNLLVLWVTLGGYSCANQNSVEFAGYECMNINEEDIILNNESALSDYERYGIIGDYDLPLTKAIRSDSMTTYIGILLSGQVEALHEQLLNNSIESKTVSGRNYYFDEIDNKHVVRCLYYQKDLNYGVVINFVASSKSIAKRIFSKDDFFNDISCKD